MKVIRIPLLFIVVISSVNARSSIDLQDMLHAAILNDSAQEVRNAIKAGANPNKEIETVALIPPVTMHTDGNKLIIKTKSHVAKNSKEEEAATQSSAEAKQDISKQTPLLLALSIKHYNAVQALLDGGAKPDEQLIKKVFEESDFNTALSFLKKEPTISEQGVKDYMRICINALNQPTLIGQQPMLLEVIQQLIKRGYKVNDIWGLEQQMRGDLSIFYGNNEVLKLFLKNGANPNALYIHGTYSCTPLLRAITLASRKGSTTTSGIKILLEAGANINQKANPINSGPLSPTALAKRLNNQELLKLFKEKGGKVNI